MTTELEILRRWEAEQPHYDAWGRFIVHTVIDGLSGIKSCGGDWGFCAGGEGRSMGGNWDGGQAGESKCKPSKLRVKSS